MTFIEQLGRVKAAGQIVHRIADQKSQAAQAAKAYFREEVEHLWPLAETDDQRKLVEAERARWPAGQ